MPRKLCFRTEISACYSSLSAAPVTAGKSDKRFCERWPELGRRPKKASKYLSRNFRLDIQPVDIFFGLAGRSFTLCISYQRQ